MAPLDPVRRGITLMEVLISIGILAIGLSSVAALLPAARSQAGRAVVLDRAATLAANALADAATFGLLRPDSLTAVPTGTTAVVVDPAMTASGILGNTVLAGIRKPGVFATGTAGGLGNVLAASPAFHRLFTQSRDDVIVDGSLSPDDPPLEVFAEGIRSFEGRMTCLLCLVGGVGPADPGRIAVVVFHGRDPALQVVPATVTNLSASISSAALGGRSLRDVIKPGVILWEPQGRRFHQAVAAALDTTTGSMFLTLVPGGGAFLSSAPVAVQFLPDSVGLAERPFVPETTSRFTE